jgi:hypothetical protein
MSDPTKSHEPTPPGVPTWVKVSAIIAAVLVAILVVALLMGGHGPGRHMGAADGRGRTPIIEHAS